MFTLAETSLVDLLFFSVEEKVNDKVAMADIISTIITFDFINIIIENKKF